MPLPPELIPAYKNLWQLVQDGATAVDEQGRYIYRSTDVVAAASQLARNAGSSLSFAYASAIPTLFALARGNARASDALTAANLDSRITAAMIGEWPTAASLATQAAQPKYMAKGEFTYTNALGETVTGWVSITGITQIPPSANNLRLRLQGVALSQYTRTRKQGGTPLTDAELMTEFGSFTSLQFYIV